MDAIEGQDREGRSKRRDFHVDVTAVFELKRKMLACHASQRDWLMRQHGIDEYLDSQERWGAHRGEEVGVAYAEAFRQYLGILTRMTTCCWSLLGQDGKGKQV